MKYLFRKINRTNNKGKFAHCTIREPDTSRFHLPRHTRRNKHAFSLVETATAVIILGLISSSVLLVINRCLVSATNSTLRMHAFEVARENMEKLLASDSVTEMNKYGTSDKYPQIQWQTTVETFYEPITNRMWVRSVCSAEYNDANDTPQSVELTHWLTNLTKKELVQVIQQRQEKLAKQTETGQETPPEESPEQTPEETPQEQPEQPSEVPPDMDFCSLSASECIDVLNNIGGDRELFNEWFRCCWPTVMRQNR